MAVRNCCYVAVCSALEAIRRPRGRRAAGHIVAAARLQLVIMIMMIIIITVPAKPHNSDTDDDDADQ